MIDFMKGRKGESLSRRLIFGLVWLIFAAFAVSYIYVFVWGVLAGLKTHDEIIMKPFALPRKWLFAHYAEVFTRLSANGTNFFQMLGNSVYFSVLGPFFNNMVTCMLAFVTCKYSFRGAKFYYFLVMIVITFPLYGNGGSMYKLLFNLGMVNSYSHILTAFAGINMNYLFYYSAFKTLSWTYAEAAYVDGAGDYTVFFRVMFPQIVSMFGALFLLSWVADWNNYSSVLIYLPKMPTLAGGIYMFELEMIYEVRADILYAAYMISAIPPLCIFAIFNKTLTSNVSIGGIKD